MSVKTEPLRYDNRKECVSRCEHAGKDREFVYRGDKSCKIVKKQTRLDRSAWEPCECCKSAKFMNGNAMHNFCTECGRQLTDAAWDMLEKRLESAKP